MLSKFCSINGLPATHYFRYICCCFVSKFCSTNGLPATHYFSQICCCLQSKFFSTDQEIWYSLEYFFRNWNHGIDIYVWEIFWKQTSDIKEIWSVSAHNSEIRITESKLAMATFQPFSDVIFVWIFFSEIGITESTLAMATFQPFSDVIFVWIFFSEIEIVESKFFRVNFFFMCRIFKHIVGSLILRLYFNNF